MPRASGSFCLIQDIQVMISRYSKGLAILAVVISFQCSYSSLRNHMPATRQFLTLPKADVNGLPSDTDALVLRVLQFNVLADGLSALRDDLGHFNRLTKDILEWDHRKSRILHEVTQYEPDIITMQEVDHYYDFFLPELSLRGYSGFFAPKPTSACLEVSSNGDGCAMFVKRSKLRVISCETKTLALSIAGLNVEGELVEDDKSIKAQSQVGMIAVCEICNWKEQNNNSGNQKSDENKDLNRNADDSGGGGSIEERGPPPPIIISTTHLKSSKSYTGERYRQKGVLQILNDTDKIYTAMSSVGRTPAVVLLGCFNAIAQESEYPPLTYRAVKSHRLGLRSVYNEDVPLCGAPLSNKELYSTWKSRKKLGAELVVKRCIDYIFYTPFIKGENNIKKNELPGYTVNADAIKKSNTAVVAYRNTDIAVAYSAYQIFITVTLRFAAIFGLALFPSTSIVSSELEILEKIFIVTISFIIFSIFELASEGTIFKPEISAPFSTPKFLSVNNEKLAEKRFAENLIKATIGGLSSFFKKEEVDGRPGLKCVSVLDVFSDEEIGDAFLPSESYPSDHIAIASDLQLLW